MPATWSSILVRYGEIGIKGNVRGRFERKLATNVEEMLVREGVEGVAEREQGRLLVRTNDAPAALDVIRRTFGVVSASLAEEMPTDAAAIAETVAKRSRDVVPEGASFAVRVRRTGTHPYTSMQLAKEVGSAVWNAHAGKINVDLTSPDRELFVEVRDARAWFYVDAVQGPGGLPVGTQGRVAVLVEDAKGALAAWLMLKRGTSPTLLVPESARGLVPRLERWAPRLRVDEVALAGGEGDRRAEALRHVAAFARARRWNALAVGDDLDALTRLAPLDPEATIPVFRPLIGFPGARLADLARQAEIPLEVAA